MAHEEKVLFDRCFKCPECGHVFHDDVVVTLSVESNAWIDAHQRWLDSLPDDRREAQEAYERQRHRALDVQAAWREKKLEPPDSIARIVAGALGPDRPVGWKNFAHEVRVFRKDRHTPSVCRVELAVKPLTVDVAVHMELEEVQRLLGPRAAAAKARGPWTVIPVRSLRGIPALRAVLRAAWDRIGALPPREGNSR